MPTDPQVYREAMSRFAGAVHVVTTDGPGGRRGVTATAATSVSDDPPTVLVCLNAGNPKNAAFAANGVFALNVLSAGSEAVAQAFAGAGNLSPDDRFASGGWNFAATGAPLLAAALVAFDCRIADIRRVATHHVILGVVETIRFGPDAPPLLYHARGYRLL